MQDNIPDALITAFERQYDSSWNDPQLRNERLAMRYGWAAAIEQKQCLLQIQEPASNHSEIPSSSVMPNNCAAAVAVPDEREAFEAWAREYGTWDVERDDVQSIGIASYTDVAVVVAWHAWQARAALAATQAQDVNWDAELGLTAMRFVDRAGDVHPGIDDAETICADFYAAMISVIDRMPHVQRMKTDAAMRKSAAAPVLPEPDLYVRPSIAAYELPWQVCNGSASAEPAYLAETVRALLATGGQAQAVEQEPFGYFKAELFGWTDCGPDDEGAVALYERPQAQADARDADDADLIEWLSGQYLAADFHWGEPKTPVLVIEIPATASVCGDFRTDVRAAIAAAKGE